MQHIRERWQTSLEAYREAAAMHRRSEDRLRSLLAREHTAEQRERHRIARELHDDLQQRLAAISLELAALRQQMPRDGGVFEEGLRRTTTMTVDAIVATRRIVSGLRPRALDEVGLAAALEQLGQAFAARTGVSCDVQVRQTPSGMEAITPVEADCLYRVAQEALQNVEKHAAARTVKVQLTAELPGLYELEIADDGIFLDADSKHPIAHGAPRELLATARHPTVSAFLHRRALADGAAQAAAPQALPAPGTAPVGAVAAAEPAR